MLDRRELAETYEVVNSHGELLQNADLSAFAGDIGPMVLISRTDLIDLLGSAADGADLRMGTTIATSTRTPARSRSSSAMATPRSSTC